MTKLRRLHFVALIISWVVDIVGSTVFGLIYLGVLVAIGRLDAATLSDSAALNAAILASPDIFAGTMTGGLLFSLIAGYVAARIADGRRCSTARFLRSPVCRLTCCRSTNSRSSPSGWRPWASFWRRRWESSVGAFASCRSGAGRAVAYRRLRSRGLERCGGSTPV